MAARPLHATVRHPAMKDVYPYDPPQHSHLIVRGTVQEVTLEYRSMEEWGLGPGPQFGAQKVRIGVAEVLEGQWDERELIIFTLSGSWSFDSSREYVFCAKWRNTPAGRFLMGGTSTGLFEKQGKQWTRCESFPAPGEVESISREQMLDRIREASLPGVTDASDLIARGMIDSVWTSQYLASEGRVGRLAHWRLRVTEWLKGRGVGNSVEFVVPLVEASYVPECYVEVAIDLRQRSRLPTRTVRNTESGAVGGKRCSGLTPSRSPSRLFY
jgi:hypothetical protein